MAWNPAAEKIFGYSATEMVGQHARRIVPAEFRPMVDNIMTALIEERGGNYSINENVTKDGRTITCEWINTVLYSDQQEVLGIYSIVQDITTRTQTEAALRQSEATLHQQAIVLAELSQSPAISQGHLDVAFREITECTARNLQVGRVSIWLLDSSSTLVRCQDLFELDTQHHSSGQELRMADYPVYFDALRREGDFAIDDALTDARTHEFINSYLTPLGVTSLLECTLGSDGQLVGVLSLEAVGNPALGKPPKKTLPAPWLIW